MPDKMTISHRGARYEIGRGKRYYGIWVAGAPESAPIDRWPETREGWAQAWTRFVSIETPGTINAVEQPRSGVRFPGFRLPGKSPGGTPLSGTRPRLVAAAILGLGVVLGIAGLFPSYFTGQSLVSQADQLVPHLLYLAGWAASAVLIGLGAAKTRAGALLGAGLSAVTLGLFLSDLGEVLSGSSGLEAGLVISIVGWGACTVGVGAGLALRPTAAAASPAVMPDMSPLASPDGSATATATASGQDAAEITDAGSTDAGSTDAGTDDILTLGEPDAETADIPLADTSAANWAPSYGTAPYGTAPYGTMPPGTIAPGATAPGPMSATGAWTTRRQGPVRPTVQHAGPIALLVLGAIGTVAAFVPSWDSYTLSSSSAGTQTITLGNAFTQPGWVISGDVIVMIAVVAVAFLAALWRPPRQGAALLGGAIIPMVAQAISAVIQISQPTAPSQFGISQSQASAAGLTITNGLTPIFWVYCVFVIAMLISCAWLITEPELQAGAAPVPSAWPVPHGGPVPPTADGSEEKPGDDSAEKPGSGEPTAEAVTGEAGETRGETGTEGTDNDGGREDGGGEDDEESTYA